jgi:hypothetical protein
MEYRYRKEGHMPQLKGPVPQVQAKEGPMPQLVKKRRSGWAVLAAGALIASLLAVGSAPAGAAEIKAGEDNTAEPNVKPTFSACVGEAVDDQGFTDLGTLDHAKTNINCLAYYGISAGRTTDTFDPNANVRRSEMALFLYAAASKAGVDLMGGDGDADYGDIADLGENWQNAITALARNGIMSGSGGNFRPNDDITRAEMAVALVNLVRHTAPGNFVQAGTAKGQLVVNGAPITSDALDHFADSRARVPRAVDTAISYAYELGITSGVGGGMFGPSDAVPRRDMATFIMNALAHSNLRPAGLTVQSDNGSLTASIRDADFMPVANELVDAFYVDATREARAFNNDGECRSIVKAVDGTTTSTCEISVLDSATDADGNTSLNGLTARQIGKGATVWVWTGDAKDEVDDDTDLVKFDQGPVTAPTAASKITVSPSQAKTPSARFGTAVSFTGQLQYVDGGLDKDTSVGADVEMGGAQYILVKHVYTGTIGTGAGNFSVAEDTGVVTAQDSGGTALGLVSRSAPETLKSDAEGKLTFSLSTDDPNPAATSLNDSRTVVYVLTPAKNAPGAGDPPTARESGYVVFGEASSTRTSVSVESIGSYAELPASASNPTNHGVTVTVRDQYGRPMRNQPVELTTSVTDGTTVLPGSRRTGSAGSVRIFYSHSGTALITETITAWSQSSTTSTTDDPDITDATRPATCPATGAYSFETGFDGVYTATTGRCGTASVYWAQRTSNFEQDANTPLAILAANLADDEVVVAGPLLVRYDDNDIFHTTVPDGAGDDTASYTDMEGFEALLATIVDPANQALVNPTDQSDLSGKRNGTLVWDGYDHDDEDARTLFTFVLTVVA